MSSAAEVGMDLLRRLLAGERGQVPLHLAMLLEKSSPCNHGDEHYREILPLELAALRLSQETSEDIIDALCAEISRNPDQALIFAVSFTGADQATKTAARIFASPVRQLTMSEYHGLLALLGSYLPYRIAENADLVPRDQLERIVQLAEELQNISETGTESERSARIGVKVNAAELLKRLRLHGVIAPKG